METADGRGGAITVDQVSGDRPLCVDRVMYRAYRGASGGANGGSGVCLT